MPRIEGVESFKGEAYHTAQWPHTPVSFEGKRVGIIGTGATAVQTIQEVVKTVGHLTVFQRTPNWCAPLHNAKIGAEEMREIKTRYDEIFARCKETNACFVHTPDPRGTFEVSDEEREAAFERLYNTPGFGIWQGNFKDILTDREGERGDLGIRRAQDPRAREGSGRRRQADPQEPRLRHAPGAARDEILRGLQPAEREARRHQGNADRAHHGEGHQDQRYVEYEFDMIIYATGFDAITGSFHRIDWRGVDGRTLKDAWTGGPKTFVGVQVEGFPNMFMLIGPHTALGNIPRSIEYNVEWVTDLIAYMQEHDLTYADPRPEAVAAWTENVHAAGEGLLTNEIDSWMTGINSNVEGKTGPHDRALQRQRARLPRLVRCRGSRRLQGNRPQVAPHHHPPESNRAPRGRGARSILILKTCVCYALTPAPSTAALAFCTARCTFSKARTSIWRMRSRLTPNSADRSSSVAGSSRRRRASKMRRSRSLSVVMRRRRDRPCAAPSSSLSARRSS